MRDSKWIGGLSASMPSVEAARKVLAARLAPVAHFLPMAAHRPEEDVEYVHQLRVGTRRAGAALSIFEDFLERKIFKSARKQLRDIRRAAGKARDADVFMKRLQTEIADPQPAVAAVLHFLMGLMWQRRVHAQEELKKVAEDGFDVSLVVNAVGEARHFDTPRRFGRLAATLVNPLLHDFDAAVAEPTEDIAKLHEVRIRGKQLRYAMEIFSPCFAAPFRDALYPAVEEVQEILGDFNDCHNLKHSLESFLPRLDLLPSSLQQGYHEGLDILADRASQQADSLYSQFLDWKQRWSELRRNTPNGCPLMVERS